MTWLASLVRRLFPHPEPPRPTVDPRHIDAAVQRSRRTTRDMQALREALDGRVRVIIEQEERHDYPGRA